MDRELQHDVVILGAGLAGLRAAVEISRRLDGKVDIGIVSKVQLMRAHSVCAEGGTAAVLRDGPGRLARAARLGHGQGLRLPRRPGRGADASSTRSRRRSASSTTGASPGPATTTATSRSARSAGTATRGRRWPPTRPASSRCRRCTTSCSATATFTRYDEFFVTDILVNGGALRGARRPRHGHGRDGRDPRQGAAHRLGRRRHLYGFTTYSQTVTGDGMAMAYRAGLPLEDMEFLQFHPTGLVPNGHPHDRGLPRRGRLPAEQQGRALHGELRAQARRAGAARHGLPRRDRGDPRRARLQDARRAGLPRARPHPPRRGPHQHAAAAHPRGDASSSSGSTRSTKPIPIRPVAHYSMGGIETDITGQTRVAGIWAAGEAACVSLHGGEPAGLQLDRRVPGLGRHHRREIAAALPGSRRPRRCRPKGGGRRGARPAGARPRGRREPLRAAPRAAGDHGRERRRLPQRRRPGEGAGEDRRGPPARGARPGRRHSRASTTPTSSTPSSWRTWSTWPRSPWPGRWPARSRAAPTPGATSPTRDDEKWLKHTLAFHADDGPRLEYKPVTIDMWKPVERKY